MTDTRLSPVGQAIPLFGGPFNGQLRVTSNPGVIDFVLPMFGEWHIDRWEEEGRGSEAVPITFGHYRIYRLVWFAPPRDDPAPVPYPSGPMSTAFSSVVGDTSFSRRINEWRVRNTYEGFIATHDEMDYKAAMKLPTLFYWMAT